MLPNATRLTLRLNRAFKLIRLKGLRTFEEILLESLNRLSLDRLKEEYFALDDVLRPQFAEDFYAAHDDVLGAMQNEDGLFKAWKADCRINDIAELKEAFRRSGRREEYYGLVSGLAGKRLAMIAEGKSKLVIAKALFDERRALTIKYKLATPGDLMEFVFKRNELEYVEKNFGDKWGMTWEGALLKYGGEDLTKLTPKALDDLYDKIAEGAARSAAENKKKLGEMFLGTFTQKAPVEVEPFKKIMIKYRMNP